MLHKLYFIIISFLFVCTAYPIDLNPTSTAGAGQVKISYMFDLFSSVGNFGNDGAIVSFSSDESFYQIDNIATFRYAVDEKVEFLAGGTFRYNESQTGATVLTNSGLLSYRLGVKYVFPTIDAVKYSASFLYKLSGIKNDHYESKPTDIIALGDDNNVVSAGVSISYDLFSNLYLYGTLMFNQPSGDQSRELGFDVHSHLFYNKLGILLGAEGIMSLNADPFTQDPTQKYFIGEGNTALYNSINRSMFSPYIAINLGLGNWGIVGKAGYRMWGESSDGGYGIQVQVTYSSNKKKKWSTEDISQFKQYELDATVIKVSKEQTFIKVDQGRIHGVKEGMTFDIFKKDYAGGNILIASGIIINLGGDWAIVKVKRRYVKIAIKNGFAARGGKH